MRFDDRLKTVLAQPARSAHDRAVRWRQLVELLARVSGPATALVERAQAEARSERDHIDEQLRAATARAVARPQLPMHVVAMFAADTITVAAPVLAAASLDGEEWGQVLEGASAEARRFVLALHPELQSEASAAEVEEAQEPQKPQEPQVPEQVDEPETSPPPPPTVATPIPSISEVVARIEQLREARRQAEEPPESRRGAVSGAALFRWECGPSGEIAWVEGAPRGALIGRSLANPGENNGVDERIKRAFALRAPFREANLTVAGEGAAAGEWKVSGVPAFEPNDGRFAGYRGVATRAGGAVESAPERPAMDDDSVRELVHELKTPLNAIIGFAEIIDGQYLGPADFAYRERAGQIVAQARLLLAAIEDLDTAAQLRSAAAQAGGSSELGEVMAALAPELKDQAARRGASLVLHALGRAPCGLERGLAERIVRRFCSGIVEAASAGERLTIAVDSDQRRCCVSVDRPLALQGRSLDELLGSASIGEGEGASLGSAFSVRLARALAQVAGGDVVETGSSLMLRLPGGTR